MATEKRPGLRDRVKRRPVDADEVLYGAAPVSQEPGTPGSQRSTGTPVPRPSGKPRTRVSRGVKKKTYTLPLEVVETIDKIHEQLFVARPGKDPIEKSQIASTALELGLADVETLRQALIGDELDDQAAGE